MNYQEMTDFEINKAVADKLGYAGRTSRHPQLEDVVLISSSHGGIIIDYCNSWADAGQIAHQYKINLYFSNNENMAEHRQTGKEIITCTDYNPCRAICIVFLMMKGGE
ncbi:DUF2591 family protein [Rosenbergiella sp. S61]|uniref:DUF2591 family protein n=1 Tax=Rosenbergiella gaditana TaxID=2726987 RepID=A0ABS5SZF3_9GAMM|nr:phage protein NinX family protein [Rosenbergiella gaditana]MBT0725436.1 DUF2591 family protein [Rosenbergiella gaditana]